MLLIPIPLNAEFLHIVGKEAVTVNSSRRNSELLGQPLALCPYVVITNCINRSSMRFEPKNLSHIQQSWSHRTHTKVKSVAGEIPKVESSSQQILIPVYRQLGQKDSIINPALFQ